MKARRRVNKHPWQRIAKPFAFKAWTKKNKPLHVLVENAWQQKHPECVK
jgi:hypothetical protein